MYIYGLQHRRESLIFPLFQWFLVTTVRSSIKLKHMAAHT